MRFLLVRVGLVVVVVALARLGAWLLVAAITSSVVILRRERWREVCNRQPRQLAVLAVLAAENSDAEPRLPLLALQTMTEAKDSLERTKDLLRSRSSFFQWASGSDAVALTEHAAESRPWLQPQRPRRGWTTLALWSLATTVLALAVPRTTSVWSALLFIASFTGTVAALTDLRHDRQWTPLRLEALALAPPTRLQPLTELTARSRESSPAVIHRAQRVLRSLDLDERVRSDAHTLLELERKDSFGAPQPRWRRIAGNAASVIAGVATWIA